MGEHRIVMMGPPGSGKGTQARRLAGRLGVSHVSVGALLRAEIDANSDLGRRVAEEVATGELVDDALVVAAVVDHLGSLDGGWILDGAPRTVAQAEMLSSVLEADPPARVVCLDVPTDEIRSRLLARAGREDRADDTPAVIEHRIATWGHEAPPLIAYYRQRQMLVLADGTGSVDAIAERVVAAVS